MTDRICPEAPGCDSCPMPHECTTLRIEKELARLHERLDGYEKLFAQLGAALQSNPMLKAMIPGGLKVS